MTTLEDWRLKIKAAYEASVAARNFVASLRAQAAYELAPYKLGCRVLVRMNYVGEAKEYEISDVSMFWGVNDKTDRPHFSYKGRKINRDGSVSKAVRVLYGDIWLTSQLQEDSAASTPEPPAKSPR